jgi:AAA domain
MVRPGLGKSFVALSMAMQVASGQPWLANNVKRCPVLYLAGEGRYRDIANRVCAAREHYDIPRGDPDRLQIDFVCGEIDVFGTDSDIDRAAEYAQGMARRYRSAQRSIIVDTLAACTVGADENTARAMGQVLRNLRRLSATCQSTVLIVHHRGCQQHPRTGALSHPGRSVPRHRLDYGDRAARHIALVGLIASGNDTVAIDEWRKACQIAGLTKAKTDGAFRKAFKSAKDMLVELESIEIDGKNVRLTKR